MELQIGVVGLGAIGRDHVKRLTERITGCKVAAVSEMNEELGRKVAQQYNAKFYADGEELINSPEVQAVMVTTWDPAHAQYVLAAIRAGKYVFCEKPLATEVSECETILAEEQKFGKRIVQVGFMRRYDPGYVEMKQAIEDGKIGLPLIVHACHRNMNHAATMTSEMSIKNSGVHEIDIFRWLLDDEYVSGQVVLPRQSRISAGEGLQDPQIMMLRTKRGSASMWRSARVPDTDTIFSAKWWVILEPSAFQIRPRSSPKQIAPERRPSCRTGRTALSKRIISKCRTGWIVCEREKS